ncbi:cytochrome P450 [Rhizodiscina lignyota]|uniref:Cytochrome P450 n=1 Tax=Rhizodiscina lignyota TaxID=1504668 RepID=A0A9P4IAW2_9PEZI|nr:cytochrome P450 [Rhizodiscina lignyota]
MGLLQSISAALPLPAQENQWLVLVPSFVITTLLVTIGVLYFNYNPSIPSNAPRPFSKYSLPIIGALKFFTHREDFLFEGKKSSPNGNFSFIVGKYHVVGLSGPDGRKKFFESKELAFAEGYAALFNGGPPPKKGSDPNYDPTESAFSKHFSSRLLHMLKRDILSNGTKLLCGDTKARLLELANANVKITDPFESVYRIVFQLTMRTVGCNELAEDDVQREKVLQLYQVIEDSTTPATVIFPWFPGPAMIRRTIAGGRLYSIIQNIMDDRKKTGRRENDPLQHMMDMGDDTMAILTVVIGGLFAGLLNSGVNAAWLLVYLAANPEWQDKIRQELYDTCAKHVEDKTAPLIDQLCALDMDVWESSFPTLDMCLKDSIRIQTLGTAFRRNITGRDVKIGDEVIPNGAVVTLSFNDFHFDPEMYPDPEKWDPSRYERGEDKKQPYGWTGWGAGRHPCLGMKFAKLEMNVIIAMFLACFEYELSDKNGGPGTVPPVNRNAHSATRPQQRPYLKYKVREGAFA